MAVSTTYIRWFEDLSIGDVPLVGGKNASLGEMYRELAEKGVRVPNGFAVTAEAYRYFLRETGLDQKIIEILSDLDTNDVDRASESGGELEGLWDDSPDIGSTPDGDEERR